MAVGKSQVTISWVKLQKGKGKFAEREINKTKRLCTKILRIRIVPLSMSMSMSTLCSKVPSDKRRYLNLRLQVLIESAFSVWGFWHVGGKREEVHVQP